MKFEVKKNVCAVFKPYTLSITVDTKEEHLVIRKIATSDITIPDALYNSYEDPDNNKLTAEILQGLSDVIYKNNIGGVT